MQIESLAGLGHLASTLAEWHVEEFGNLYDEAVWNREVAVREMEQMATPGSTDLTLVAFSGSGRVASNVLGSVSLIATDDLPGFDHLTPWLASLFVVPAGRGRGVGAALIEAAVELAAARGDDVLHLFTPGHEAYYLERGWRTITRVELGAQTATVMARAEMKTAKTPLTRAVSYVPNGPIAGSASQVAGSALMMSSRVSAVLPSVASMVMAPLPFAPTA